MEREKGFGEDLKGEKALERIGRGEGFGEDWKGKKAVERTGRKKGCGEDWKGEKGFGEDWKGDQKKGSGKDWKRKKKATCSLLQELHSEQAWLHPDRSAQRLPSLYTFCPPPECAHLSQSQPG